MAAPVLIARGPAGWIQGLRRRTTHWPWISFSIVGILLICAAFAPLLAPHDPTLISMLDAKLAPGENSSYILGTDVMGRDMLSRLIYGARTSVLISMVALGARGPWWVRSWGWSPATEGAGSTRLPCERRTPPWASHPF